MGTLRTTLAGYRLVCTSLGAVGRLAMMTLKNGVSKICRAMVFPKITGKQGTLIIVIACAYI